MKYKKEVICFNDGNMEDATRYSDIIFIYLLELKHSSLNSKLKIYTDEELWLTAQLAYLTYSDSYRFKDYPKVMARLIKKKELKIGEILRSYKNPYKNNKTKINELKLDDIANAINTYLEIYTFLEMYPGIQPGISIFSKEFLKVSTLESAIISIINGMGATPLQIALGKAHKFAITKI